MIKDEVEAKDEAHCVGICRGLDVFCWRVAVAARLWGYPGAGSCSSPGNEGALHVRRLQ